MHDTFISYSSKDPNIAKAICHHLEAKGIRCWMAPRDIPPGGDWEGSIVEAIQRARVFVLIFSDNSNNSLQVAKELTLAVNDRLMIIPYKITDTLPKDKFKYLLADIHWLDAIGIPEKTSIEHLGNVISLYLNKENDDDFKAKYKEEETKLHERIKRRRRNRLTSYACTALALLSAIATYGLMHGSKWMADRPRGYSASICLMRYKDADTQLGAYNDSLLKSFRYEKDYDGDNNYCVFPASNVIAYDTEKTILATKARTDSLPPVAFHYPTFQLRLVSHERKSITMSEAVIEIRDMHKDDRPAYRVNANNGRLTIGDENFMGPKEVTLAYSSLSEGESFLKYKKTQQLTINAPLCHENIQWLGDSIIGEISTTGQLAVHFASGANLPDSPYLPKKMMRADKRLYLLNSIKNQDIRLSDFNRDLKHKEVDSGFSFRIGSPDNVTFKMRLRININGSKDSLYTNFINVRLAHPAHGVCHPQ